MRKNLMMNHHSKYFRLFENEVTGVEKKVMLAILKYMEADMNTIVLLGDTMNLITGELCISKQQVRNATSTLARLNLIEPTRILRAEYIVNPCFAWKGDEDKTWRFYSKLEHQVREYKGSSDDDY